MTVLPRLGPAGASVKEIRSVRNACSLLEAVATHQPVGVSELARLTGIDKSAVQRLAVTLHAAGWLAPASGPTTRWEIPPTNPLLIHAAGSGLEAMAGPAMEHLRDSTGETVILVTRRNGLLVIAAAVESRQPIRLSPTVGYQIPYEGSASGSAIAAQLPQEERQRVQEEHPVLTPRKLEKVRRTGWAANDREVSAGVRSVAAAIMWDGYPVGALAVCGPATRVSAEQLPRLGAMVIAAAGEVLSEQPGRRR